MLFGQDRVNHFQQVGLFPSLEHDNRPLFSGHGVQLTAAIRGFDGVMEVAFQRQIEPLLRALLDFEAHAGGKAQHPQ